MKKIYETDRLILRTINPSFTKQVLEYYIRNKAFLEPYEPFRNKFFYTPTFHRKTLKHEVELMNQLALLRLWIFKKEDIRFEKIIGTISFSSIVRGCFQSCFLGYKLDKDEVRQGFMSEALTCGIQIMFEDYKLHRIEANILPRNTPSVNLVEKLGFQYEGTSKNYLKINGVWEDHCHMVLLNDAIE